MKKIDWKEISQFEGPEQSPGFLLWKVSTQWRRQIESALLTLDLTHPQFVLLASLGWLTRNDAKIVQVELARHCNTDINMTSQVLRILERKEYIKRYQSEGNKRSKFLRITKQGSELIKRAIVVVEEVDQIFFESLKQESGKYIEILQKLIK